MTSLPPTREPAGGSIRLTTPRALVIAALVGAVGGWLIVLVANLMGLTPPLVPWTAPVALILITALVGVLAYTTHQRIHVRRQRAATAEDAARAVSFLVLGKASALAGALVTGGYFTFALMFITRLDAVAPRDRVIRSGVAVVAGIALMIAGLLLERACRVPGTGIDGESDIDADSDTGT